MWPSRCSTLINEEELSRLKSASSGHCKLFVALFLRGKGVSLALTAAPKLVGDVDVKCICFPLPEAHLAHIRKVLREAVEMDNEQLIEESSNIKQGPWVQLQESDVTYAAVVENEPGKCQMWYQYC